VEVKVNTPAPGFTNTFVNVTV